MHTIENQVVFHTGWPDDDWVKGFHVVIKPHVNLDFDSVKEAMVASTLEEVDPNLTRFYFPDHWLGFTSEATYIYAGRDDDLHCGKQNSPMYEMARSSLDARVGFLLRSLGIELETA